MRGEGVDLANGAVIRATHPSPLPGRLAEEGFLAIVVPPNAGVGALSDARFPRRSSAVTAGFAPLWPHRKAQ